MRSLDLEQCEELGYLPAVGFYFVFTGVREGLPRANI